MNKNVDISFLKVSAAGNRFLMALGKPSPEQLIKIPQWCLSKDGFSTDGCLWLEDLGNKKYKWHFYNADGSTAEMCGNAACSALYFLKLIEQESDGVLFETLSGKVRSKNVNDTFPLNFAVEVSMPQILQNHVQLSVEDSHIQGMWIDSGVPHFVMEKSLSTFPRDFQLERKLRNHSQFAPRGTNVTYVDTSKNPIKAVSYERGVEDYTEACGTGAIAAAYFAWTQNKQKNISVEMPGGVLKVSFMDSTVILQSPVKFHGEINIYKD